MDEIIARLKMHGHGCYIGQHYVGGIAYADDLMLLSPTRSGLQSMLSVCEAFGAEYYISYNAKKTACIIFSKKETTLPEVSLNGIQIPWSPTVVHLGNVLSV